MIRTRMRQRHSGPLTTPMPVEGAVTVARWLAADRYGAPAEELELTGTTWHHTYWGIRLRHGPHEFRVQLPHDGLTGPGLEIERVISDVDAPRG